MNADQEDPRPGKEALLGSMAIDNDARTLGANIASMLRDAIISGRLAPGQPLGQEYLARVFGVSRVPVRESLKQLATEGLVAVEPHKGAVVAHLSVEELDELYGIIWSLEEAAVRVAVPRLTDEQLILLEQAMARMDMVSDPVEWYRVSVGFHRAILEASGWRRCVRIVDECRRNIGRYVTEKGFFLAHVNDWRDRNRRLLQACLARDSVAALAALDIMRRLSTAQIRAHLRQTIDAVPPDAYPLLFSPFRLGELMLRNRVVMAPMSSSLADEQGFVTPELTAFLRERAAGGTGLVIVEFSCVDASFGKGERRQLRIDDDACIAGHARLARAITQAGAGACLQLHLPGQYAVEGSCEGLPIAPSDEYAKDGRKIARSLSATEIEGLVQRFADAARRAAQAGYDAIEIHGAHGYLPMAFMSPRKNRREDAWGGNEERRLAFPLAVIRAVRAALGPRRPLIYRLSAAEFVDAGLTMDDMERIVPKLARAGCDALHISSGAIEGSLHKVVDPMSAREGWRFPLCRRLRAASGLPVIAVGPVRWPGEAERALASGDADLIALGRPLLADPHWALKARKGVLEEITPCTNCNWCMQRVRAHASIGCAENPRIGREAEAELPMVPAGAVAVVLGAGPGGLHAALELDRLGYRTHLFEARNEVGGGLIVSAAPPFKEPLRWYLAHLEWRLQSSGVQLHLGRRADSLDVLILRPDVVVVATGSRARHFPLECAPDALPVLDAATVLTGEQSVAMVGSVVVYGGGETGCETAEYLAQRGVHVVLVTRSSLKDLARSAEPMYRREMLARLSANPDIEMMAFAGIARVESETVLLTLPDGNSRRVAANALVMAQGRMADAGIVPQLRAAGLSCPVIGDAGRIGRIGDAVHAADRAVRQFVFSVAAQAGGQLPR